MRCFLTIGFGIAIALAFPASADVVPIVNGGFDPSSPSDATPFALGANSQAYILSDLGTDKPITYGNGATGPASASFLGYTVASGTDVGQSIELGSHYYTAGTSSGFVGDIENGSISQTLTTGLQADSVYTLSYSAAYRADQQNPGADFTISLYAGSTLLATSTPSEDPVNPLSSTFQNYSLPFDDSLVAPGLIGQPLEIVIANTNSLGSHQALIDNLALNVEGPSVPEPSSVALILAGLGMVVFLRHYRLQS